MLRNSLLFCLVIIGGACSSSDEDTNKADITLADAGTADAGQAPAPDATTVMSCTDQPDFNSCANCVAMENPAGSNAYSQAIVSSCYCANECVAECTAGCADPTMIQQGDACDTCLNTVTMNQNSACIAGFSAACQADATCVGFAMSLQSCQ